MKANKNISAVHEGMIVTGMSQCIGHIASISTDPFKKETHTFLEHLILSLRELGYYVEKYFGKSLDKKSLATMESVKNMRDTICHRSSPQNLLNPHLYLSGGFNFKNDDIEVQYGKTKVMLSGGLVDLYLTFRRAITNSNHFAYIKKSPSWNIEELKLQGVTKKLAGSLNTKKVTEKMREGIRKT